ncbi:hypothetical protein IWW50_002213 [Coemansia erecta]|nr:hypothetical protein IWW50_002213 [Coemansia erecta]
MQLKYLALFGIFAAVAVAIPNGRRPKPADPHNAESAAPSSKGSGSGIGIGIGLGLGIHL